MENKEIAKALGQVPNLVARTNTLIDDNARKDEIIGKFLQNRAEAEIPPAEMEKILRAIADTVANTRCAAPDAGDISHQIAGSVMNVIRDDLRGEVSGIIRETVRAIPVEHVHTHTTLHELTGMADRKLRGLVHFLAAVCIALTLMVGIGICWYANSAECLGHRYVRIYTSKYATDTEREEMRQAAYTVSALPREYRKTPNAVRQKIKRNKQILRQREKEARANKGKFSTKIPLEP